MEKVKKAFGGLWGGIVAYDVLLGSGILPTGMLGWGLSKVLDLPDWVPFVIGCVAFFVWIRVALWGIKKYYQRHPEKTAPMLIQSQIEANMRYMAGLVSADLKNERTRTQDANKAIVDCLQTIVTFLTNNVATKLDIQLLHQRIDDLDRRKADRN